MKKMKKYLVLTLVTYLYLPFISICQNNTKIEFIGALRTSTNDVISFKISFKELVNGTIEGESITDFYGENSTKSIIKGTIDRKEGKLSFEEKSNISTKSKASENEFCYIHAKNLKLKTTNSKTIVQGKFTGVFNNGKKCAEGNIYLVSADILELFNEHNLNLDSLKNIDSTNYVLLNLNKVIKENKALEKNETIEIKWKTNEITLEIFDGFAEDNDEISVYFNDSKIVDNYSIKQEKKIIKIPFSKSGTLKIEALNEGLYPPNTVNLLLKEGNRILPIRTKLKKGEFVYLKFNQN